VADECARKALERRFLQKGRIDGGETQASSPVFERSKSSLSGFMKLITLQSSVE